MLTTGTVIVTDVQTTAVQSSVTTPFISTICRTWFRFHSTKNNTNVCSDKTKKEICHQWNITSSCSRTEQALYTKCKIVIFGSMHAWSTFELQRLDHTYTHNATTTISMFNSQTSLDKNKSWQRTRSSDCNLHLNSSAMWQPPKKSSAKLHDDS